MKKTLFSVIATVAVFFISLLSVNIALCQNLNSTLESLNPFLGNTWIGKLKSPDGSKELTVLRTYEIIPKGNVLKCIKKNPELDNYAEEFFFWDDIEKKIAFFSIGDLGVFENGFVTIDNNIVTIEGTMTWPKQMNQEIKQSYNFRNTFEFTPEGKMVDKWFQNAFGPWQPGHTIEFEKQN